MFVKSLIAGIAGVSMAAVLVASPASAAVTATTAAPTTTTAAPVTTIPAALILPGTEFTSTVASMGTYNLTWGATYGTTGSKTATMLRPPPR